MTAWHLKPRQTLSCRRCAGSLSGFPRGTVEGNACVRAVPLPRMTHATPTPRHQCDLPSMVIALGRCHAPRTQGLSVVSAFSEFSWSVSVISRGRERAAGLRFKAAGSPPPALVHVAAGPCERRLQDGAVSMETTRGSCSEAEVP